MNKNEPIVAKVRNRVAELVQLPMTFAEDMQVSRRGSDWVPRPAARALYPPLPLLIHPKSKLQVPFCI